MRTALTCSVMGISSAVSPWFGPELITFQCDLGSPVTGSKGRVTLSVYVTGPTMVLSGGVAVNASRSAWVGDCFV